MNRITFSSSTIFELLLEVTFESNHIHFATFPNVQAKNWKLQELPKAYPFSNQIVPCHSTHAIRWPLRNTWKPIWFWVRDCRDAFHSCTFSSHLPIEPKNIRTQFTVNVSVLTNHAFVFVHTMCSRRAASRSVDAGNCIRSINRIIAVFVWNQRIFVCIQRHEMDRANAERE